jgi:GNAT superfamily N-acetyltransferase
MTSLSVVRVTPSGFGQYASSLSSVYAECFAEDPWNEVHDPKEVAEELAEALSVRDSIMLVAKDSDRVLGATLLYPLQFNQSMASIFDLSKAMYCQELFVAGSHQGRGVGGRLFDTATGIVMALGYERTVLRTSESHERAKRFYLSRDYQPVGVMQCRSWKRVGTVVREECDTRVVMLQENAGAFARATA